MSCPKTRSVKYINECTIERMDDSFSRASMLDRIIIPPFPFLGPFKNRLTCMPGASLSRFLPPLAAGSSDVHVVPGRRGDSFAKCRR